MLDPSPGRRRRRRTRTGVFGDRTPQSLESSSFGGEDAQSANRANGDDGANGSENARGAVSRGSDSSETRPATTTRYPSTRVAGTSGLSEAPTSDDDNGGDQNLEDCLIEGLRCLISGYNVIYKLDKGATQRAVGVTAVAACSAAKSVYDRQYRLSSSSSSSSSSSIPYQCPFNIEWLQAVHLILKDDVQLRWLPSHLEAIDDPFYRQQISEVTDSTAGTKHDASGGNVDKIYVQLSKGTGKRRAADALIEKFKTALRSRGDTTVRTARRKMRDACLKAASLVKEEDDADGVPEDDDDDDGHGNEDRDDEENVWRRDSRPLDNDPTSPSLLGRYCAGDKLEGISQDIEDAISKFEAAAESGEELHEGQQLRAECANRMLKHLTTQARHMPVSELFRDDRGGGGGEMWKRESANLDSRTCCV